MKTQEFQALIWEFAVQNNRVMPWRTNTDPYYVLVSEIMLQQTQVERVVPKFEAFISRFPSLESLAQASLSEVLRLWSGLGYNRRAKFLWLAAQKVMTDFNGTVPHTTQELLSLPGVGSGTAGAILAYSFNQPAVFVETNIRTVYFNHFSHPKSQTMGDKQLLELVEQTLDHGRPRQWYWALMDYGNYLKKNGHGRLAQSAHYKKQAPLKGSLREMRGQIIKALNTSKLSESNLRTKVKADARFEPALQALLKEQLIKRHRGTFSLA
jgi:A/G-specific adenine glycosylase